MSTVAFRVEMIEHVLGMKEGETKGKHYNRVTKTPRDRVTTTTAYTQKVSYRLSGSGLLGRMIILVQPQMFQTDV